ncbi:MAG: hypothetical protein P8X97_00780 [Candidatus Bathyarchaeota archaeon]
MKKIRISPKMSVCICLIAIVLFFSLSTLPVFADNARPYSTEPEKPWYKPRPIIFNPIPILIDFQINTYNLK